MRRGRVLLAVWLLVGVVGCGPGVSSESSSPPPSSNSPVAAVTIPSNSSTEADGHRAAAAPAPGTAQKRIVPDWMAQDLDHPDNAVRLRAQSAPTGSVDPLIQALEDTDEQVQARALELIVQNWAREQAAKP